MDSDLKKEYYHGVFPAEEVRKMCLFPGMPFTEMAVRREEGHERFLSLEHYIDKTAMLLPFDSLHVGGTYASVHPTQSELMKPDSPARGAVLRTFVLDYDLPSDRNCVACGGTKECCPSCWDRFLVPASAKISRVLEEKIACEDYEEGRPWRVFFSGRRGLHFYPPPGSPLNYLSREERVRVLARINGAIAPLEVDAGPTTELGHLVRMPFSVHGETGIPALPLVFPEGVSGMSYFMDMSLKRGLGSLGKIKRHIALCKSLWNSTQ